MFRETVELRNTFPGANGGETSQSWHLHTQKQTEIQSGSSNAKIQYKGLLCCFPRQSSELTQPQPMSQSLTASIQHHPSRAVLTRASPSMPTALNSEMSIRNVVQATGTVLCGLAKCILNVCLVWSDFPLFPEV